MRPCHLAAVVLTLSLAGCRGEESPKPPSPTEMKAMLQGGDPKTQLEAAGWAGNLGPVAAELAPELIEVLASPEPTVRQQAAVALGRLGPQVAPTTVPALVKLLNDPEPGVQRAALTSLGQLGPAASPAIAELEKLSEQHRTSDQADTCNVPETVLKQIRQSSP
jgi:HEAT repeat protein